MLTGAPVGHEAGPGAAEDHFARSNNEPAGMGGRDSHVKTPGDELGTNKKALPVARKGP